MIRRRSIAALAATIGLVAVGTLGASSATADTSTTTGLRVSEDYIACVGLRIIPIATCIEEPLGPLFETLLP